MTQMHEHTYHILHECLIIIIIHNDRLKIPIILLSIAIKHCLCIYFVTKTTFLLISNY